MAILRRASTTTGEKVGAGALNIFPSSVGDCKPLERLSDKMLSNFALPWVDLDFNLMRGKQTPTFCSISTFWPALALQSWPIALDSLLKSQDLQHSGKAQRMRVWQGVLFCPLTFSFVTKSRFYLAFLMWKNALVKTCTLLLLLVCFKVFDCLCMSKNQWPSIWIFKAVFDTPHVQNKNKKSYIQVGPTTGISWVAPFHGKQTKWETETLAGTGQYKEGKSSSSAAFVLTHGIFNICCSSLNCLWLLAVFHKCGGKPALSSVWPKDLRLTFTDNLAIVTITLTLQGSTKEQWILEPKYSSIPVCSASFLHLSLVSSLISPSSSSLFPLTFLLTFPAILSLIFPVLTSQPCIFLLLAIICTLWPWFSLLATHSFVCIETSLP